MNDKPRGFDKGAGVDGLNERAARKARMEEVRMREIAPEGILPAIFKLKPKKKRLVDGALSVGLIILGT